EGALIVLAEKGGISVDDARARYPRVAEVPFDSEYKFMATFHEMTDATGKPVVRCFVKGAPDVLIARGAYVWMPDAERLAITDENRPLAAPRRGTPARPPRKPAGSPARKTSAWQSRAGGSGWPPAATSTHRPSTA